MSPELLRLWQSGEILLEPSEEAWPCDTLTSVSWPPDLGENKACCPRPPHLYFISSPRKLALYLHSQRTATGEPIPKQSAGGPACERRAHPLPHSAPILS